MTQRSTIIVNWNCGAVIGSCLDSLRDEVAQGHEVIVVDNASTDGSLDAVVRPYIGVQVIALDENVGFAAGANAGAAAARGQALVFLNPDATVEPGAIDRLVAALRDADIAGGGLRNPDGSWQPASARFEPLTHLLFDTRVGRRRIPLRRAPFAVDWVYGTFVAIRATAFRRLAGFDPRYFCYGEDLDLCHRAAASGCRTVHVPEARAVHGANVSAVQRFGGERDGAVVRGELAFYARRWGAAAVLRYRLIGACKFAAGWTWARWRGDHPGAARFGSMLKACREGPAL